MIITKYVVVEFLVESEMDDMIRHSFNSGWTIGANKGFFNMAPGEPPQPITLPHDAMIAQKRSADAVSGNKKGFFPDKTYDYVKLFEVPVEYKDKRVTLEFEGVYMNAMVYINGDFAGQHPFGYSNFYIKADPFLKYGEENEIRVVTKSNDDSRWYTGTGIYRNTKIMVANMVHIEVDGVRITTPDITDERAIVNIETNVVNEGVHPQTTTVITEILDAAGNVVATDTAPLTVFAGGKEKLRQRLYVKQPNLWNVDTPYLYICRSKVMDGDTLLDEETHKFGIRSLSLDAVEGLKINGEVVKLRGTCIHHDNGVIGAATFARAEERRIQILKQAGFNAIRSAHNPVSKAMLDACDRLGMLVMDESFDIWTVNKSNYDYALYFPTWWEKDIEAMVNKDFNHPSVIMYSIGNEIQEVGSPHGAAWGRKLAEKIRSLDSTRYVTNSINGMLAVMDKLIKLMSGAGGAAGGAGGAAGGSGTAATGAGNPEAGGSGAAKSEIAASSAEASTDAGEAKKPSLSGDLNTAMANAGESMKRAQNNPLVTKSLAESFAAVDISGYNYADNRYVMDKELFPNRVIVGSETYPRDIASNWKLVLENGHVIGDFTWTGWDYLGEAGIGKTEPEELNPITGLTGGFPWVAAYCGDIDLLGNRRPASYYREIVFGLRKQPYIAVQRPQHYGVKPPVSPWSWSDSISSWSWDGFEGKPIVVEVYADADEVELLLNGQSIGKAAAGQENAYKALLETTYTPGELLAIAYVNGIETGRFSLQSANATTVLKAEVDRPQISNDDNDLAYVMISLVDDQGILKPLADREITVTVAGAGDLQGLGSAKPKSDEDYFDSIHTTYDGYALAVIRPSGTGIITVTIEAEGCTAKTVTIEVV